MKTTKPWKAGTPMVSSFASELKDDDRPTLSKNISPGAQLPSISPEAKIPPLSLTMSPVVQNETKQESCIIYQGRASHEPDRSKSPSASKARFSSSTAQPIEMTTPLMEMTPVNFSSRFRTADSSSKKKFLDSVSLHVQEEGGEERKRQLHEQGYIHPCIEEKTLTPLHIFDVIPIIPYGGSDLWKPLLLRLISDLLITGTPLNYFRKLLSSVEQLLSSGPGGHSRRLDREVGIDELNESQQSSNGIALRDLISSRRDSWSGSATSNVVKGIPNYGQTCFLNAVLQALASLEPFLLYLGRINQVQKDSTCFGMRGIDAVSHASVPYSGASFKNIVKPSTTPFSQELMEILLAVNGLNNGHNSTTTESSYLRRGTPKVDPRPLLVLVGEKNAQFKTHNQNLGEQQDAQELLQALLGMVIEEVQFDSTAFVSDNVRLPDQHAYEEALTAVIAVLEEGRDNNDRPHSTIESSSIERNEGNTNSVPSFSVLLKHVEARKNTQIMHHEPKNLVDDNTSHAETSGAPDGALNLPCGQSQINQPEEKKQEDFDFSAHLSQPGDVESTIDGAEDSPVAQSMPRCCNTGPDVSNLVTITSTNTQKDECIGQSSMQLSKCAISSTTPSPLSGWIGSTLQCCKCKHIRPIQNSSFFDVPLVPTSVPAYLEKGQCLHKENQSPCSPLQKPCTIQQCLSDFTSVERVQDVECRSCTIQTQIAELQDEEMLLCAAIESISKRPKNGEGDTESLRTDLQRVQDRLRKLKSANPDLEDDLLVVESDNEFVIEGDPCLTALKLERWEARKCLFFTRCPSILCCHIQRSYYDPYTNRMEKCAQFVAFDEILDISPYCAYSPFGPTAWVSGKFEPRIRPKERNTEFKILYRLQSIIEHKGNAHGGHYVSYRRLGSSWYHISDDHVSKVSWSQVQERQAYMLFYEAI